MMIQRPRLPLRPLMFSVAFAGLAGCATSPSPSLEAETQMQTQASVWHGAELRDIKLTPQRLTLKDGRELSYESGFITVPQNRSAGTEAMMQVEVSRFFAIPTAPGGVPPVFIMNGGPDFVGLKPDLEDPGYFEFFLERYTEFADVIVPGQRGFGTSGATDCEEIDPMAFEDLGDRNKQFDHFRKATTACHAKFAAEEFDVTGMNVIEAAADIGDIARSLNYETAQVWGNSFGSHLGLAAVRSNPTLFTRATFGALEGPDHTYDVPSGKVAAMGRILAEAEASEALRGQVPDGGLLKAYGAAIERAEAAPIIVQVLDPATDTPKTIALDGDALRDLIQGYTTRPSFRYRMADWPLDLLSIINGDYEEAAQEHVNEYTYMQLSPAAYYYYDCGSGISAARRQKISNDPAAHLVGEIWKNLDVDCEAWNADLGEAFRADFVSDVPVVLVHGTWDISTPYENVTEVSGFFTQHKLVTVIGGSHGAMREAEEHDPAFRTALDNWMATGDWSALPGKITLPELEWSAPAPK